MSNDSTLNAVAIHKAVALSFVASLVIGFTSGLVVVVLINAGVLTGHDVVNSVVLNRTIFCVGLFPYILGGYLVAKISTENHILHGIAVGISLLTINVLFYLLLDKGPLTTMDTVAIALTLPLAVIGAAIGKYK